MKAEMPTTIAGQSEGVKFDSKKLRMDLIPSVALEELAKVLTYGAEKYDANNWTKGIDYSRLYAACLRHLLAYKSGQSTDAESGISHLSHALCNIVFLIWHSSNRPDLNDLQENLVHGNKQT